MHVQVSLETCTHLMTSGTQASSSMLLSHRKVIQSIIFYRISAIPSSKTIILELSMRFDGKAAWRPRTWYSRVKPHSHTTSCYKHLSCNLQSKSRDETLFGFLVLSLFFNTNKCSSTAWPSEFTFSSFWQPHWDWNGTASTTSAQVHISCLFFTCVQCIVYMACMRVYLHHSFCALVHLISRDISAVHYSCVE